MFGSVSFQRERARPEITPLSPTTKMTQEFSTSNIEISYSRPGIRGRKVFGDVVAYGKPWRTGANGPTKIKFGEDVMIADNSIKAGEYILYSIPGENEWEFILNKGNGPMGPEGYNRADDVARFKIKSRGIEKPVENFTIEVTDITFNTCKIELSWEHTRLNITVMANNEARMKAAITKAINTPNIPYFQAANYYYETNQNLDSANMYVDKALETNKDAFYMWYLKARIEKKLGHKQAAISAAKMSMETAKGQALEAEYIHNNQKIIDEMSK
jgi:hypothetical protein